MTSSMPPHHSERGVMPPAPMREIRGGGGLGLRAPPTGWTLAVAEVRSWSTAWTRGGALHRTGASLPPRRCRRYGCAMGLRVRRDPRRGRLGSSPTSCGCMRRRSMHGDAIDCGRRQGIAAAGKRRGGESGEFEPGFGPASTPSTAIYRGRWGPDGGCNHDAGC
jgi:hypothetical protein